MQRKLEGGRGEDINNIPRAQRQNPAPPLKDIEGRHRDRKKGDEGGVRDGSLQLPADWQALWGSLYDGGASRERNEGKVDE